MNCWVIESQYINILTHRPLSGSSYKQLPAELKNPKRELINIKYNDKKCFLWGHVRHINPGKTYLERVTQNGKKLTIDLDYDGVRFSVREKDFSKIETKICINLFY